MIIHHCPSRLAELNLSSFQSLVFWRHFNSDESPYELVIFLYLYLFILIRNERNEVKAVLVLVSHAPRVMQYWQYHLHTGTSKL